MTTNKDFKQIVRARAAETGERYTQAHAALASQLADEGDVVAGLLGHALANGASDIHLVPDGDGTDVRIRIDGRLQTTRRLSPAAAAEAVSKLKDLAGLDATSTDGQLGRLTVPELEDGTAVRVSTLPTTTGEKLTLRFVRAAPTPPASLVRLGFEADAMSTLTQALRAGHGLIAVVAADEQRRRTIVDALTEALVRPTLDLIRIGEPGPARSGVERVAIGGSSGLSAVSAMQSVMRSDPDIVVLDLMTNDEEAEAAMELVTTGHLVVVGADRELTAFGVSLEDQARWSRCTVVDDPQNGPPAVLTP